MFKNPANDYIETVGSETWLWVLLFGSLYFAVKGVWTHAIVSAVLAFFTCGASWLIYPLFAKDIMVSHYLQKGWKRVEPKESTLPTEQKMIRSP